MAELPDLAVFAATLSRKFVGKTLSYLEVKHEKKLNVSAGELQSALEEKKLDKVERYGKTLRLHFGDQVLQLHLMLRGDLFDVVKGEEYVKSSIIRLMFSGDRGFEVRDFQKQASMTLGPADLKSPDAMEISQEEFAALLGKKHVKVKEVLMDQKLIRGIGNAYSDDMLWHARISPFSVASAIPAKAVKVLYSSMHEVLDQAIADIGKASGDEFKGELRDFMLVHRNGLEKSPSGAEIKYEKIDGRGTYFTDEQQLFK
ncbi:MAG: formamidopyrimidine-DNA glycosylase [Pedobacter sp.]|nr:MAG: formamidopyrimidine-DNA glycosylase [Pedobacter sp.]